MTEPEYGNTPGRHGGLHSLVAPGSSRLIPMAGPRHNLRRAVFLGEIRKRPHGVELGFDRAAANTRPTPGDHDAVVAALVPEEFG